MQSHTISLVAEKTGASDPLQLSTSCKEQRTAVRYPLEIPVAFRWIERGQARQSRGRTRDVSVRGVFVLSSDCPPPATRVTIRMNFTATMRSRAGWLDAEGLVLRVEPHSPTCDGGFVVESCGSRLFTR